MIRHVITTRTIAAAFTSFFFTAGYTHGTDQPDIVDRNPDLRYSVSAINLNIPSVTLMHSGGTEVNADHILSQSKPVVVQFMFTTCTTVCPIQSATLREAHSDLSPDTEVVFISIDPDHDTPTRLREYTKQLSRGPHWNYYTGEASANK